MAVPFATAVGWGISILGWAVSPIISRRINKYLDATAGSSANSIHILEDKIQDLKRILEAARLSSEGDKKLVEEWAQELKSAFYDAEDTMDAIDYHRLQWKATPHCKSANTTDEKATVKEDFNFPPGSKENLMKTLKRIEEQIDKGQKLLKKLEQSRCLTTSGGNIKNSPEQTTTSLSKTTSEPPNKVFGRDKDAKEIIRMLHDDKAADHSVIGIHGIPGSGKTTLAQYVCECVKKKNSGVPYFELIMWIHVTKNFSVDTVYHEMLEIVSGRQQDKLSNPDMLQSELKKKLKGKRLLLVLDDVWYTENVHEQDDLVKLLSPLREADKASRVLVTTRTANAATLLGAQNLMPISDMNEGEFFKMFMHYALDNSMVSDQGKAFQSIGEEIAALLQKSPLAARTVAGQLRIRTRRAEDIYFWIDTSKRKRDLLKDTMGALWWSYHQLEEHVRRCFEYCSMFPRRYELKQDELVHMWTAQGFVDASKSFEVLLSTSFIQLKHEFDGEQYYTVHDLLHDLAGTVAGSDFFRIENDVVDPQISGESRDESPGGAKNSMMQSILGCYMKICSMCFWASPRAAAPLARGMNPPLPQIPQDVRHLFINSHSDNLGKLMEQIVKLDSLRTLVMSSSASAAKITAEDFECMLKNLKKLRFVHVCLKGMLEENVIPDCIGELKHLRYLGLDGTLSNRCIELPLAFTRLYHLQGILVRPFDTKLHCPHNQIADLENLRHIIGARLSIPYIGRMTGLQTVCVFTVKKEKGYEITQLENLNNIRGEMYIWGLENIPSKEEARGANLRDKRYLKKLTLDWTSFRDEDPGSSSSKKQKAEVVTPPNSPKPEPEEILEALHPPNLLEKLTIESYSGSTFPTWLSGEEDGKLNNLKVLFFGRCDRSDSRLKFGKTLPGLHELEIEWCSWNALPDNIQQLASLEELTICGCENIKSLPGLPSSLKELSIEDCPNISTLPELPASLEELIIWNCPNIKSLPELPPSLEFLQCQKYLVDSYPDRQAIDRIQVEYFDDPDSETDDDLDSETDDSME